MALIFKITLLAVLSVYLTNAAPNPQEQLSERDQKLAKITGTTTLAGIQQAFQQVFQSSDIDEVLQQVSTATKKKDAVAFLSFCVEITQTPNIQEASKIFLATTTQKLTFLEVLQKTAKMVGHDLQDFYLQIVKQTASKSLGEAAQVLVSLLGENDLFIMLQKVAQYTSHTDPIEIHETEFKATRSSTLQEAFGKLSKATSTKNILQAYATIKKITKRDPVDIIAAVGALKALSWDWEECIRVLTKSTKTSDFVSALKALPEATGKEDAISALELIRRITETDYPNYAF